MKNNSKYFANAKHLASERFRGVDGFNNMNGGYAMADGGAANNMARYNPATSSPYEFECANANTTATAAAFFDSFNARTAANFNNLSGITITSSVPNVTYGALLAQSETKNFECGLTYIQVTAGSNSGLTATWALTTGNADGQFEIKSLTPKKDPNQNQVDVITFPYTFKINGYTKISLTIPASTTIKYSFYPSATMDPGRTLGQVPELMNYAAPQVGTPQTLDFSPTALAALRQ